MIPIFEGNAGARVHDEERQVVYGGPNCYARSSATKHFREFLMAGPPAPKAPETTDKMLTLPELEDLLRTKEKLPDAAQTH